MEHLEITQPKKNCIAHLLYLFKCIFFYLYTVAPRDKALANMKEQTKRKALFFVCALGFVCVL